jgi:hypothetical protein
MFRLFSLTIFIYLQDEGDCKSRTDSLHYGYYQASFTYTVLCILIFLICFDCHHIYSHFLLLSKQVIKAQRLCTVPLLSFSIFCVIFVIFFVLWRRVNIKPYELIKYYVHFVKLIKIFSQLANSTAEESLSRIQGPADFSGGRVKGPGSADRSGLTRKRVNASLKRRPVKKIC